VRYVNFLGRYYKLSGKIVETEAYGCNNDPASHAFRKITNRNKVMFGDTGRIYVYFVYGSHYCFNIVAKDMDCTAGAILIRSVQPIEGVNLMRIFRRTDNLMNLTSGPGKLTQAFKISEIHNGFDITANNNLFYLDDDNQENKNSNKFKVLETSRIGISSALEKKWRFIMLNPKERSNEYITNPFVSKRG
jgi:DNA-3-methyladenine glycosylase